MCYKEFWTEALLVIVIPNGNVFYAQKFDELEVRSKYDLSIDFLRYEHAFPRVTDETIIQYKNEGLKSME
jgi:hypothetical protein